MKKATFGKRSYGVFLQMVQLDGVVAGHSLLQRAVCSRKETKPSLSCCFTVCSRNVYSLVWCVACVSLSSTDSTVKGSSNIRGRAMQEDFG